MNIEQAKEISKLMETKERYRKDVKTLQRILDGDITTARPNEDTRFNISIEESFTNTGRNYRVPQLEFGVVSLMIETAIEYLGDEADNIEKRIEEL